MHQFMFCYPSIYAAPPQTLRRSRNKWTTARYQMYLPLQTSETFTEPADSSGLLMSCCCCQPNPCAVCVSQTQMLLALSAASISPSSPSLGLTGLTSLTGLHLTYKQSQPDVQPLAALRHLEDLALQSIWPQSSCHHELSRSQQSLRHVTLASDS